MSMPSFLGPSRPSQPQVLNSHNVRLEMRQQPSHGLVTQDNKEKGRKPIDPPPIVQMIVSPQPSDDNPDQWLVSPYLFMIATLLEGEKGESIVPGKHIIGQNSSSLHRLKDISNKDGGFFVFGDLSVKKLGVHRLRFSLFNADQHGGVFVGSIISQPFDVVPIKEFRGLQESSHLSRAFSDQGVRLRLRKEARQLGSNAAGTKRHFESPEDATPPEAQAPAYQNSGAQYGYGAPAVKRQRSDNEYNNPYAYAPHYQDNTPRYYSATPDARSYGAQAQAYPQTQTMLGVGAMPVQASFQNAHGQYHLQSTVQTSQTPAASSATTGNWTGAFPHAPLSAPAGSSGQPAYGRNTLSTRPTYYNDWQQHQQPDVPYGAQTHAAPYYHTPNSMTADTPQNAAYLPSNVGHGADVDHANMADSSLGEQNVLQGGPDSMWTPSSHSSLPTLPALSSLATSSGAYYQQPYPETSKYPDPTIAATSMSDPYQYTTISTSASPLLTYSGPALQNATLNSAYTAEAYQGQ